MVRTARWGVLAMLALSLWPAEALAGGFFLTDRGTRQLGRGYAFVAGADDPFALWYNPAGLAASGQQLSFDLNWTLLDASFSRIDSGGNELPTVDADPRPLPVPTLAFSQPVHEQWTLGIGLSAMNIVPLEWPAGIDAQGSPCSPSDPECGPAPQRYSLLSLGRTVLFNLAAGAAYTPLDSPSRGTLSLGAGLQLMMGPLEVQTTLSGCEGFICTQPENPEWDAVVRYRDPWVMEPVITGGAQYTWRWLRAGASVTWWPRPLKGDADVDVRLPSAAIFDRAEISGDQAEISVPFPLTLRTGIEVRPIAPLRIETALVWERWSKQRNISVEANGIDVLNVIGIGDYEVGTIDIPRQMNDTWSLRIGGDYDLIDDRLTLRSGFNYENSSFDDAYLTPLTIDSRKFLLALGVGVRVGPGVWLDAAYGHVFLQNRSVRNSQVPQLTPIRPPRSESEPPPDGAIFVGNGDYNLRAHTVGISVRWIPWT